MSLNIALSGLVLLREDYVNERERAYYALLRVTFSAQGNYPSPETRIELPITEQQYRLLREELSTSTAQEPVLRLNGNIETLLGFRSIN